MVHVGIAPIVLSWSTVHIHASLPVCKINDPLEQKGTASGSSEASGDELSAISEYSVASGTRKEASPSNVFQEYSTHLGWPTCALDPFSLSRQLAHFQWLSS